MLFKLLTDVGLELFFDPAESFIEFILGHAWSIEGFFKLGIGELTD